MRVNLGVLRSTSDGSARAIAVCKLAFDMVIVQSYLSFAELPLLRERESMWRKEIKKKDGQKERRARNEETVERKEKMIKHNDW